MSASASISPTLSASASLSPSHSLSPSSSVSPSPAPTADVYVAIDGIQYATDRLTDSKKVLYETLTISDLLDETPNTCQFTMKGVKPLLGQDLIITLGDSPADGPVGQRLFGGVVRSVNQAYVGSPANAEYHISGIDYTWLLTLTKVNAQFTNELGAHIVQWLLAQSPYGFTMQNVDPDLDTVDEISFSNTTIIEALAQLAKQLGEHVQVDYYKDVHLPSDTGIDAPDDLVPGHDSLDAVSFDQDISQVVTRVLIEGGGSTVLADCAGGETIIPVETVDWFNTNGGTLVVGNQRLTYTGVRSGGGGTLIGPGVGPVSAPAASAVYGSGVTDGVHLYGVTFVTAAGESLISPTASITAGLTTIDPPPNGPIVSGSGVLGGSLTNFYYYGYLVTFVTATGETTGGALNALNPGFNNAIQVSGIPTSTDTAVTSRKLYRTTGDAGSAHAYAGPWLLVTTIADNVTTTYTDGLADGSLGVAVPTTNTATSPHGQVSLASIPLGQASVTARKVYRTAAGASQPKLLTTLADNITTTYTDTTADGSLGANAPTSDTSGLTQPAGQVLAGATSIIVAGTANFQSGGGWAIVGNGQQVVRYTGFSGSNLIGIPSSGNGSITASINYGSSITAAHVITGVPATGTGCVLYPITKGESINLLVQADDVSAQVIMASLIGNGSDGIIEDYQRISGITETEALAEANATLTLRSAAEGRLRYRCRDPKSASGTTVRVNLTNPNPVAITGDFLIQQVDWSMFRQGGLYPTCDVQASTLRFTFEDLLRLARKAA